MVDGDRSKSVSSESPKKKEQTLADLNHKDIRAQGKAMGEILKGKGLNVDSFFKR